MKYSVLILGILLSAIKVSALGPNGHMPGNIIVQIKNNKWTPLRESVARIKTSLSAFGVMKVTHFKTDNSLLHIKIEDDHDLINAIQKLENLPEVEFAEPNYRVKAFSPKERMLSESGIPNDPFFKKTWGLLNTGQEGQSNNYGKLGADINVLPLWQTGQIGSKKVLVAVIDTGVDWTHEDLRENIYVNNGEAGELAHNGKDDDQNGFVDDVHGWNFVDKNNQSMDDNGHGTHCAGTIGAVGNNGIGVAGVNWNTHILPIKFLNKNGSGEVADAIESVNYAVKMGARVLNNSWGGSGPSKALKQAIEKANAANSLFVVAAGNDNFNNDEFHTYPSHFEIPNILTVAASDNLDQKAYFSNFGPLTVHVAAPGSEIFSTVPNNQYEYLSGTSMATPHVAGIAALLISIQPDLSAVEIKNRLIRTSKPIYELKRYLFSKGRVNVYNALNNIVEKPNVPDESAWKDYAFTLESPHPYLKNTFFEHKLVIPNAKMIRLVFAKVEFEKLRDFIRIEDKHAIWIDQITGISDNYVSDFAQGNELLIKMETNATKHFYGFKIVKAQFIE